MPAPGQYLYTETQSSYGVTLFAADAASDEMVEVATAQFGETDQAWTGADGVGHMVRTVGAVGFPSAADEAAWQASASGPSMLQQIAHYGEDGGQSDPERLLDVSDLPTDPTTLASVIAAGGLDTNVDLIPAGPDATFERAATLLAGPTEGMTPALSSALFEVLAGQAGVQLLGPVTDHNGQQGQGVVLSGAGGTEVSEVVVDPTTGALLEARYAPPAATMPTGGNICVTPTDVASGSAATPPCPHVVGSTVIAPLWTDVVSSGLVGSATGTLPPVGNAATTITSVPGAPTGLVSVTEDNQVHLSWGAPLDAGASAITDYVVYEYDGPSTTSGVAAVFDTHSTATTYTWAFPDTSAPSDTFTVQAVNGDGFGPASAPATAVIVGSVCPAPTGPSSPCPSHAP